MKAETKVTHDKPHAVIDMSDISPEMDGEHSVYAWKRSEEWLYVGCTSNFWRRLANHNVIGKADPVLAEDRILVWRLPDFPCASEFEAHLINRFQPRFNVYEKTHMLSSGSCRVIPCMICNEAFMQKRVWQKYCKKCRH